MTIQMKARSARRVHEELVMVELEPITPNADTAKGSQPTSTLTVEVNPRTPLGQRLLAAVWDASVLTWRLDEPMDALVAEVEHNHADRQGCSEGCPVWEVEFPSTSAPA